MSDVLVRKDDLRAVDIRESEPDDAPLDPGEVRLQLDERAGADAVVEVHRAFVDGTADPRRGYVLRV